MSFAWIHQEPFFLKISKASLPVFWFPGCNENSDLIRFISFHTYNFHSYNVSLWKVSWSLCHQHYEIYQGCLWQIYSRLLHLNCTVSTFDPKIWGFLFWDTGILSPMFPSPPLYTSFFPCLLFRFKDFWIPCDVALVFSPLCILYLLLSILRTLSTHHHDIVVVCGCYFWIHIFKYKKTFLSVYIYWNTQFFGFGEEKC